MIYFSVEVVEKVEVTDRKKEEKGRQSNRWCRICLVVCLLSYSCFAVALLLLLMMMLHWCQDQADHIKGFESHQSELQTPIIDWNITLLMVSMMILDVLHSFCCHFANFYSIYMIPPILGSSWSELACMYLKIGHKNKFLQQYEGPKGVDGVMVGVPYLGKMRCFLFF